MNKKETLLNFMKNGMGKYDKYEIEGNYGYSYNSVYEQVVLYKIEKDIEEGYIVDERVLRLDDIEECLGVNFFDNAHSTKIKKVRKYFNMYCY